MKYSSNIAGLTFNVLAVFFNFANVYSQVHDHSHERTTKEIQEEFIKDSIETFELLERTKREFNISKKNNKSINCATDNYDFEIGSTNQWTTTNNVQIMSGGGIDPYGLFPVVYPGGGGFSVKLGSDQGNFQGKLSRVIQVPPSGQSLLSFHFAMCIFNYPHTAVDAAKFSVKFYDQNNVLLACPQYECYFADPVGPVGVANMQQTAQVATFYNPAAQGAGWFNVTWSGWTDVTIDLSGYAGQNVIAVFDNKYCAYTPDWCYAYVDIDCPTSTPNNNSACIDIPGIVSGPPSAATYAWYNSSGTIIGNNQNQQINTPGNYTLVTTINSGPCAAGSQLTYNYTINENPTANFTASAVCEENNSIFTNTSTTFNSAIWDFGDLGNSVAISPLHLFANDGTFNVSLTVTTPEGCIDDVIQQVTVHPKPVANFTAPGRCTGFPTPFTSTSAVTSGNIIAWTWSNSNTIFSNLVSPSYTFPSDGDYPIELIVTTNNGCKDTVINSITVYPEPLVSNQDLTVCNDLACGLTLGDDIDGPTASTFNIISINSNGLSSSAGTPLVANGLLNSNLFDDAWTNTTNAAVDVIYTIVPISAIGCEGTPFTVTLTINPEPMVPNQVAAVCSEELIGVTLANDPNGPNLQSWNITNISIGSSLVPNSGNVNVGTTISNQYIAGDIYVNSSILGIDVIYTVIPKAVNSCVGTPFTITITVNPLPVFNVFDAVVCADHYVTLTGNPSSYSYSWDHGVSNNVPFIPPYTDTYNVVATNTITGCIQNSSALVTVHPNPISDFTDICGSIPATLTNTSTGAVNYYWDMGDGSPIITSKDISYSYTIMDSMFYNIILIAETEFGCLDTASKIFTPPLLFYVPNTFTPDGDEFNNTFIPVFSNKNKVESIHLLIYNRWGEIVFESENIDFGWDGTYKNRKAQDGIYAWELIFTNNSCKGKKEHIYGAVNLLR